MRKILLAALAAAMIPAMAFAQGGPGGGPGGPAGNGMRGHGGGDREGRMATALDLTDEQAEKVRQIHSAKRKDLIDVQASIQKAMIDLTDELQKDKPNQATIDSSIEKIVVLKSKMERSKLQSMVEVSSILTPEQKKKAATRMTGMGMFGEKGSNTQRPGGRDGRGGRGGPDMR
ncbi:MAG: periplasmic heavy metal sensor [Nitrospinota bacterium]|nr:periplasmic heavy metal sensor [Nitrospinota bacterium]MDH5757724.1 periplasmic heavy metal sensor [Nitrospinota bacterium]